MDWQPLPQKASLEPLLRVKAFWISTGNEQESSREMTSCLVPEAKFTAAITGRTNVLVWATARTVRGDLAWLQWREYSLDGEFCGYSSDDCYDDSWICEECEMHNEDVKPDICEYVWGEVKGCSMFPM